MRVEKLEDGRVAVDRDWIRRTYGLSLEWSRRRLPVYGYSADGAALHLLTPEAVALIKGARARRRSGRDTPVARRGA